jgi:hypothetical protein
MQPPEKKPEVVFTPTKMQSFDGWYVQAMVPGVPPIQLGGFKTEEEAAEWVRRKSKGWLEQHQGHYF